MDSPVGDERRLMPVDIAATLDAAPAEPVEDEAPSGPVTRPVEGAWLGGVCQGLEDRLGWPTPLTRLFFLVSSAWMFVGVAVYAFLWLLFPKAKPDVAVGVAAASRAGYRTQDTRAARRTGFVVGVALALCGVGVASLMWHAGSTWARTFAFGWMLRHAFAVLGVATGGALIWRQWDQLDRRRSVGANWLALGKAAFGALLAGASVIVQIGLETGWGEAGYVALVGGVVLVVAVLLAGPWLLHPEVRAAERDEAIKGQARADIAAHLHDSVLQTLAMIQRQAGDQKAVARLARHQERELREWLYGESPDDESLVQALKSEAAEVEDAYGVPVDVVTVGDAELTPELDALVRAAREAILNAAKHSGAPRVDVYAEMSDDLAQVFVRDRGRGFDAAQVTQDRMGIRGSILDRMHRYGGVVGLRSTAGEGTEVRLEMKR